MAAKAVFALGLDFGTNSARALLVDAHNGREVATAAADYPSGIEGVFSHKKDPNVARQQPGDYAVAMTRCVKAAVKEAGAVRGFSTERVIGIGVDTTASTPIPVDASVGAASAFPHRGGTVWTSELRVPTSRAVQVLREDSVHFCLRGCTFTASARTEVGTNRGTTRWCPLQDKYCSLSSSSAVECFRGSNGSTICNIASGIVS